MTWLRTRLQIRLIVALTLFSSVVTLLLTGFQLYTDLNRDLSDVGGLGRLVMSMRLNRAHDELAFGASTRGVVSRTAERWGFSSESHFSREFKRKFGFRPGDAVAAGPAIFSRGAPPVTDADARIEKWLRQL